MNYFTCLYLHVHTYAAVRYALYDMCHNFNLAAGEIAWTNIQKHTHSVQRQSTHKTVKFGRFRHKISCVCILIRHYFWLMVYMRIFDKFLLFFAPSISYHHSHISTNPHTHIFTHTKSKISCNGFMLTPVWCVERVVELVYFSLFINNESFYMREKKRENTWLGFRIWKTNQMWSK